MPILVIEGGQPNGMDLVMGEHLTNPRAQAKAKANGQQIIKVIDLGDDFALAGARILPTFDQDKKHLCFLLVAEAGKNSSLVGLQVVPTVIAELGRIAVEDLKAGITGALNPPEAA